MEMSYIMTMSNFPILVKTLLIFPIPWAPATFPISGVRALSNVMLVTGFPQVLTWKIVKNSTMYGKIVELKKNLNNHGKINEFCEIIFLTKPPVARKPAVRHTKLVCLIASFLASGGSKFQ